jgi:hypothetical protein
MHTALTRGISFHTMTYASHMTTQGSRMVHTAPLSCLMTPMWYIQCTVTQHGAICSQTAPIWIILVPQGTMHLPCGTIWFPYGEHGSNMAHIWFSSCTFGLHLPSGSHTLHEGLPYSACGSHRAYTAPIWCLRLSHGAQCSHMAHMAPVMCTWLSHGPQMAHTAPI